MKKLSLKELENMIKENVQKIEKEMDKKAKKTKEVEADEYADTLENKVDWKKVAKIKEAAQNLDLKLENQEKLLSLKLKEVRNRRLTLRKAAKGE
jgi:hypothetical protein